MIAILFGAAIPGAGTPSPHPTASARKSESISGTGAPTDRKPRACVGTVLARRPLENTRPIPRPRCRKREVARMARTSCGRSGRNGKRRRTDRRRGKTAASLSRAAATRRGRTRNWGLRSPVRCDRSDPPSEAAGPARRPPGGRTSARGRWEPRSGPPG